MTSNFISPLFSVKPALAEDKEATAHLLAGLELDGYDISAASRFSEKGPGGAQPHPILVDREMWESKDPSIVPLLTDVSKVKSSSDRGDKMRQNEFEFREEENYYERETLEGRSFVQIRSPDDIDRHLEPLMDVIKNSVLPLVACGYDTEGKSATMQIAVRMEGPFGGTKPFERNALIHLKSESGRHCLAKGIPAKLVEFFTMEKIVFVGKSVKDDIITIAKLLKVPGVILQQLKYVELDQVFNFAYNYSRSEAKLLNWVKNMPKKSGLGPLGLPGLKNIHSFAKPTHVLGKLDKLRDDRSNWEEKKGPLKPVEMRYAVLDAIVGLDSLMSICQKILGIRWQNFVRVVGHNDNEYYLPHLPSIVEAMVGEREMSSLDANERRDLESLLRNVAEIERRVESHQRRALGWSWKKEIFLAELKLQRKGSPYVIKDKATGEALLERYKKDPPIATKINESTAKTLAIDNGAVTESAAKALAIVNGAASENAASALAVAYGAATDDAAAPYAITAPATNGIGSTTVGGEPSHVEAGGDAEETVAEIGMDTQKGEALDQNGSTVGNDTENIDMGTGDMIDDPLREEMALFEASLPKNVISPSLESTSSTSLISSSSGYSSSSNPPPPVPPPPPLPLSLPLPSPRPHIVSPIRVSSSTERRRPVVPSSSGFVATGSRLGIQDHKVKRTVASLRRREVDIRVSLTALRSGDVKEMTDNFIGTLKEFRANSNDGKKMALIAREMKKFFRGESLHEFVMRVINEDVFGKGRLRAAAGMNYFLLSPFIIVDNLLAPKRDGDAMRTMVRAFRGAPAMSVIKFVAENYGDKVAILEKLRAQDCFVGYEVDDFDTKWTLARLKDFIRHTCRLLEQPIPDAARPIFVAVDVESYVRPFLRGEIEEYDFFHVCSSLTGTDEALFKIAVGVVATHAPHLANYLAARANLPPVQIPENISELIPACATPFNAELHNLPLDGSLVVRNSGSVQEFKVNLERSRYFSVDLHCTTDENQENEISFITFCTRSKIFHVPPRVFPDLMPRVIEILKSTPRPIFIFRWNSVRKDFLRQFGWVPEDENIVEVMEVAKEIGISPSLDAITEKTVGGVFCRRAANFAVVGLPSEVAQRHCAIKATLLYEFVTKFRRLREQRRQQRQQQQQPPSSANSGRGHRHRRERDQELLPSERRRHEDRGRDRSHRR